MTKGLWAKARLGPHKLGWTGHTDAHLAVVAELNTIVERSLQYCLALSDLNYAVAARSLDLDPAHYML